MRRLDLSGLLCPLPTLRTLKALRDLAPGEVLEVLATDPMAATDLPEAVQAAGAAVDLDRAADGVLRFTIRRP